MTKKQRVQYKKQQMKHQEEQAPVPHISMMAVLGCCVGIAIVMALLLF